MNVTKITDNVWDDALSKLSYISAYQKSWWYRSIEKYIGGEFRSFRIKNDLIDCLIPCFIGKPWSEHGFRIGSIGYGGPIFLNKEDNNNFKPLISILEKELRLSCTGLTHMPVEQTFEHNLTQGQFLITQILSLPKDLNTLFESMYSGNVRTTLRKAQKHNIETRKINKDNFSDAYQLLITTQKNVGSSYTTPEDFLYHLICNSMEQSLGLGAYYSGKMISMGVIIFSNQEAAYYLHGWNREYSYTGANQLMIHHLILKAIQNRCKYFNFGESHFESLRESKKRWGCNDFHVLRSSFAK